MNTLIALGILLLFFWTLGEKRVNKLRADTKGNWIFLVFISFAPILIWVSLSALNSHFRLDHLGIVSFSYIAPALLVYVSQYIIRSQPQKFLRYGDSQKILFTDALAIFLIWFLFDFRITKSAWQLGINARGEEVGYFLNIFLSLTYIIILFRVWRGIDLHFRWKLKREDFFFLFRSYTLLAGTLMVLSVASGLVRFEIIRKEMLIIIPLLLVGGFFHPALSEELFFRGLLQNMLSKRVGTTIGILISSLLFGLGHINNNQFGFGYPNWPFVSLATIAGLGYGIVYHKRKSLALAAGLHIAVDFTHWIFFGGK